MTRALQIAKLLLLLSAALLCLALSVTSYRSDEVLGRVSDELDEVHVTVIKLDSTIEKVDVTIKEAQYPILQAGLTSKKEADMLDVWNRQMTHTLGDLDAAIVTANDSTAAVSGSAVQTLQALSATADQVKSSVQQIDPALQESAQTLRDSQEMLQAATKLLADPDVTRTLKNTADTTQHLSATAGDVQDAVHTYLHPGWKVRVFNWSATVAHTIGGWF